MQTNTIQDSTKAMLLHSSPPEVKVVGMVKVIKSNLHDFWYRCLVRGLIHIHKVLCRSRLVCNN